MGTLQDLIKEAEGLPEEQRLTLANRILSYGENERQTGVDKAWELIIRERIAGLESGTAQVLAASEVFFAVDRKLSK